MKSRSDYYSKILGMSLTHNPDAQVAVNPDNSFEESFEEEVSEKRQYSFLLVASLEDINSEKEMVQKILKALNVDMDFITTDLDAKTSDNIFTFGDMSISSDLVTQEFPPLLEIAKDQSLKKELWNTLKGFKA